MIGPPPCVGTFESNNLECNGSEQDPYPCAWRDRCGAFKTHLRRAKQSPTKWLKLPGWELRRWCDQWVEAYEIEDGTPKNERGDAKKIELREAFDKLVVYLLEQTNRDVANGRLALPGELYLVDHFAQNKYVAIYGRARQGHDKPFVRLQLKPRAKVVEVRTPLNDNDITQAFGIDAQPINSGKFKSKVLVDADDLEHVGRILVTLANSGAIKLPPRARK